MAHQFSYSVPFSRGMVTGTDATVPVRSFVIAPGLRGALNFSSGLQIVPGIAFPIGAGPSRGERSVLLYMSFEHPFRKPARVGKTS